MWLKKTLILILALLAFVVLVYGFYYENNIPDKKYNFIVEKDHSQKVLIYEADNKVLYYKEYDYFIELQKAIPFIKKEDESTYYKVDSILKKLKDDKNVSDKVKTLILWKIMLLKPIIFDYFSIFLIYLSPSSIIDDLLLFSSNESNNIINRVNSLIVMNAGVVECLKNKDKICINKVYNFIYPMVINPDQYDGLYTGYIEIYRLIEGYDNFNKTLIDVVSKNKNISRDNYLAIFNGLRLTLPPNDFLKAVNNSNLDDFDKKDMIYTIISEKNNILSSDDRKVFRDYLDTQVIELKNDEETVSLSDIDSWVNKYFLVADKELASIKVFKTYEIEPYILSEIISDNIESIDILAVESKTDALKNMYQAYLLKKSRGSDDAEIIKKSFNMIFEKEPKLRYKYSL